MKLLGILPLLGVTLLFTGCVGYQLGPVKPADMTHVNRLAVPTFKNNTLEPRAAVLITNEVIKQLQVDGSYQVGTLENADAILRGTITRIHRRQLRGARTDVLKTRELEVRLIVEYAVEDVRTGGELATGTVEGRTNVFLDPNFQLSERQAVQQASEKLAQRLVSQISEGW